MTATKIQVLQYSASRVNPYNNTAGTLYADFSCVATMKNLPPGWTVLSYNWGPTAPFPPNAAANMGVLVFPAPGFGATQTGTAYNSNTHYASCTAIVMNDLGWTTSYSNSVEVAVIGGPLGLNVWDAQLPTWRQDDDSPSAPFNVQYFGHDPQVVPPLAQVPQKGVFNVSLPQPDGTVTVTKISGPVVVLQNTGSQLKFAATAGSASGGIVPKARFSLSYGGTGLSGVDCSPQMPDPATYTFTAHAPKNLVATLDHQGPLSPQFGWSRADKLRLFDHLGKGMPGVWVQERFDPGTPLPSGFWTSNVLYLWQTGFVPPGDATPYDVFSTGSGHLQYSYAANPTQPMWNLHQHYYAGTKDPLWGSPGGILVGDYWIKYWTDRIDHIRIPP